jgi:gliding motility-associated-like protein
VVTAGPPDITSYELLVTDANGCSDRDTVVVDVETELQAAFTVGPIEGTAPAFIDFENTSQAAIYYVWDYGDGITDSLFSPNHLYTDSGTYRVVLYAISAGGCRDTAVYEFIHLDQHVYAFIPNIFTPNADGLNELFVVNSLGFISMNGQIFNRWGKLMSSVDFVSGGWDGKTNGGADVSAGTYFYTIDALDFYGKKHRFNGFIELVR